MRTERRRYLVRKSALLPGAYESLEYIENAGKAYIDCGLEPKPTYQYEIKSDVVTGNCVFGCYFYDEQKDYRFFFVNNMFYFDVGNTRLNGLKPKLPYHVMFGNYFIKDLDENTGISKGAYDEKLNNAKVSNLYLLYGYGNVKGKVYLLRIFDGDVTVRDFIPSRRKSDDMIGMYDLVENKFYTSPNGEKFVGGKSG